MYKELLDKLTKGGTGSGKQGHTTPLDPNKHIGVTRTGKPIPKNFEDSHEHEYTLEDHQDAMNHHQDFADQVNERIAAFQEKNPNKPVPKAVTDTVAHHLNQSRKHQAISNRLQDLRNRNEKQVADAFKKAEVMADYNGTVLDTNDLANEINSQKECPWLRLLSETMKDYNYGDEPKEVSLDNGNRLYLTKVDEGLYSGFVKRMNSEDELPETIREVRIERMPLSTLVTLLRTKELIDLVEDKVEPIKESDAANLLEKLEPYLEPVVEDELMNNPKKDKVRILELIKEILEDVN